MKTKTVTIIAVETEYGDYGVLGDSLHGAMEKAGATSSTVIVFDADHPPRRRQRRGLKGLFGKRETGRLFDGIT